VIHDETGRPVTDPVTGFIRQYHVDAVGRTVRSKDGSLVCATFDEGGSIVLGPNGELEMTEFRQDPRWRDHRGNPIP
jgi:hypothetical protein